MNATRLCRIARKSIVNVASIDEMAKEIAKLHTKLNAIQHTLRNVDMRNVSSAELYLVLQKRDTLRDVPDPAIGQMIRKQKEQQMSKEFEAEEDVEAKICEHMPKTLKQTIEYEERMKRIRKEQEFYQSESGRAFANHPR